MHVWIHKKSLNHIWPDWTPKLSYRFSSSLTIPLIGNSFSSPISFSFPLLSYCQWAASHFQHVHSHLTTGLVSRVICHGRTRYKAGDSEENDGNPYPPFNNQLPTVTLSLSTQCWFGEQGTCFLLIFSATNQEKNGKPRNRSLEFPREETDVFCFITALENTKFKK